MSEMDIPQGVPIDPERIASLVKIAIETHAEADDFVALRDSGKVQQTLEVEQTEDGEDEVHLYFDLPAEEIERKKAINPDVPDRLHVAAWPLADCLPSQN
jgi:hypothetical protein